MERLKLYNHQNVEFQMINTDEIGEVVEKLFLT